MIILTQQDISTLILAIFQRKLDESSYLLRDLVYKRGRESWLLQMVKSYGYVFMCHFLSYTRMIRDRNNFYRIQQISMPVGVGILFRLY